MGKVSPVEFDQNAETKFYCCRHCRTHIALSQACTARMEGLWRGYFSRVANLLFNETGLSDELQCVKCNQHLGWRYIDSVPVNIKRAFLLKLDALLFWNGQLFRDADEPKRPAGMRKILSAT